MSVCEPVSDLFTTTLWSRVKAARVGSVERNVDLQFLCERYWYPIYVCIRYRVRDPHQAEDLTQSFFAYLIDNDLPGKSDPNRGRFRDFLQACCRNFLNSEQRKPVNHAVLPLELGPEAESRYPMEPEAPDDETAYLRAWAHQLILDAQVRLEEEETDAGHGAVYAKLKGHLNGGPPEGFAAAAAVLNMTEKALKARAYRLRNRCRQILREAIGETVDSAEDIDDEIRVLLRSLGR